MNLNDVLGEWSGLLGPKKNTTPVAPDIENPKWQSADEQGLLDDAGQMTFKSETHGHAGIRTIHGALDLLTAVGEELIDWENKEEAERAEKLLPEDLRRVLAAAPRPILALANLMPARAFHTETVSIPVGNPALGDQWTLLSARSDRMWIEIVNQGANPVLLSHTDDPNFAVAGSIAAITLPALAGNPIPRRLPVGGKIYVYSVLGSTVDYVEAYGIRNEVLDYVNP